MPYNAISKRGYNGLNVLLLWGASQDYGCNGWLTYKQARAAGGHVRKGEKGTRIIFWKMLQKDSKTKRDDSGNPVKESFPMLRTYTVFNIRQCDGLDLVAPEPVHVEPDSITESIRAMVPVNIAGGDRAFYRPATDEVTMPRPDQFHQFTDYTSTLLHEATHATGHKSRLGRDLTGRFGGESYAAEELIAEMGSAFLCAAIGHDFNPQHSSYIKSWLRVLKDDERAIFTASSMAQKAADYVKGYLIEEGETAEEIDNQ